MKPPENPPIPRWLRISGLLLISGFLVWIPFEDVNETWAIILGALVCAWFAARHLMLTEKNKLPAWAHHVLTGVIAGLSLTPVVLLLMALKTGFHGHAGVADFTPQQMSRVVELTPAWALAGILIGLGTGVLNMLRSK